MEEELRQPIKILRLNQLWVRIVLAQKMLSADLNTPDWLKHTFAPEVIRHFKKVVTPKSQKLHPTHPFFASFIPTLANYDAWRASRKGVRKPKKSTLELFFETCVAPEISIALDKKYSAQTLKILYSFLKVCSSLIISPFHHLRSCE